MQPHVLNIIFLRDFFAFFSHVPICYGSTLLWKEDIDLEGAWTRPNMIGIDFKIFGLFGGVLKL